MTNGQKRREGDYRWKEKKRGGQWKKGEFKLPSEKHRAGLSSTICTYGKGF